MTCSRPVTLVVQIVEGGLYREVIMFDREVGRHVQPKGTVNESRVPQQRESDG